MANRRNAVIGSEFTLDANFRANGVLTDPASVTKVVLQDIDGEVLHTATDITHVSTGVYRVTIPALDEHGDLFDVWTLVAAEGGTPDILVLEVHVYAFNAEGEAAEDADPALSSDDTCELTATFRDASGEPKQGVLVRFTAQTETNANTSFGFVSGPVTAQSDAEGAVSLKLIRGLKGTLAVTGIHLVRQVTIPDVATIDIFALVNNAADPFAVQSLDSFVDLPRSS